MAKSMNDLVAKKKLEKLESKIKRYEDYLQESLEHWNSFGDKPVRAESVAASISDFLDDEKSF